jgi:hypothetical protein
MKKSSNSTEQHNTFDMPEQTQNIEALIDLKFTVEREWNTLNETFKKMKERKLTVNLDFIEISRPFCEYQTNVATYGEPFKNKLMELINQINAILIEKCEHNWIDDTLDGPFSSRDYCYCSRCFIKK